MAGLAHGLLSCLADGGNRLLIQYSGEWKYKKLKGHTNRAEHGFGRVACRNTCLFVHWQRGRLLAAGRYGSRMR